MEQRVKQVLVVSALLVGGLAFGTTMQGDPPVADPPAPASGLSCFRQQGLHSYCDCLDRLESARAIAGKTATKLPPLDNPLIRYALQHPDVYPIITVDTERCLRPRLPRPVPHRSPA